MPIRWRHSARDFKWQVDQDSGLPVTTIERIGAGTYVMACNLCGCSHHLLANEPTTGVYKPACSNGQYTCLWANYRRDWIRKYPESANHRTIMLRAVEAQPNGQEATQAEPAPLELVEKPKRQRQSRKKAA